MSLTRSIPSTAPSSPTRIDKLIGGLKIDRMRGAEIAPLSRATVTKAQGNITYIDRLSTAELVAMHGGAPYLNVADILPTDIVIGDRSAADLLGDEPKFDYVVGSHVIEHVADLVSWLSDMARILKPGGAFRVAVPDKRFTFDYLRQETKVSEVLNAYANKVKTPTSQCILDHYLNVRKVDFIAAWDGAIDPETLEPFHTPEFAMAAASSPTPPPNHPDIHCWVYTPRSFATLMLELAKLRLMPFACEQIFETEPYTFEFFVRMRACDDPKTIATSWQVKASMLFDDERDLRGQLVAARRERDALLRSTSWRVTAPLRAIRPFMGL